MKKAFLLSIALLPALTLPAKEKIILVNEGMWQTDNGQLTYFEDGEVVSNQWFRDVNGRKLGDTPNDIILVNDGIIAIAANWSNIIQFITPDGKAVGETEDVPNNRKLASDGRYVYVTSYAHEVGIDGDFRQFEKGYVAKIDATTFKTVDAVEVGYEPEGIALYGGHLFVANSGGYSFQEGHDYEHSVSVIDPATMKVVRTVDVEQINLYSKVSLSGQYLCINSPGDYYETPAATVILDCRAVLDGKPDAECFVLLPVASTSNTADTDGNFLTVGSSYSYLTGEYEFHYCTINPEEVCLSRGEAGVYIGLPGSVEEGIAGMAMPYSIFVNPYSGYIYATDAGEYTGAGAMYQWDPEGNFLGKHKTYINPGHFLALPPEKPQNGVTAPATDLPEMEGAIYNMQGIRVKNPISGNIYIKNGKKIIF
ncbi:MAG: hypothetical protein J1F07_03195 [Muribaculaceae bacterium]|nr:hypothetical protein [Muribaculaceae bacterium]